MARKPKTHCIRGHEFTPENTRVLRKGKACKTCDNLRNACGNGLEKPDRDKVFIDKIDKSTGLGPAGECWHWTGFVDDAGYGRTTFKDKAMGAHRASFIVHKGEIGEGLLVCHRCDNPLCVNPAHLFLGTFKANTQDMMSKGRHFRQKQTHCKRGHELGEPLVLPNGASRRRCSICDKANLKARRDKKRAGNTSR